MERRHGFRKHKKFARVKRQIEAMVRQGIEPDEEKLRLLNRLGKRHLKLDPQWKPNAPNQK